METIIAESCWSGLEPNPRLSSGWANRHLADTLHITITQWRGVFTQKPRRRKWPTINNHIISNDRSIIWPSVFMTQSKLRITFWQQTLCVLCGHILTGSLFGNRGSRSVQLVNYQAISGGAPGEDRPHFWFVLAFDCSVCRPLKITGSRRRRRRRVIWEVSSTLSMTSQWFSLTWRPGELAPSAQALPWKHTSLLRTCCYASCKLQQKPEEEMMQRNEILSLFKITDNVNKRNMKPLS